MRIQAMEATDSHGLRVAVAQQLSASALIQVGSGATVGALLGRIGLGPTAFLRLALSSAVLCTVRRPDWRAFSRSTRVEVTALAVVLALQSYLTLTAFERLPLGVVVSITFLGPLGLAAARMPRARSLIWPLLAIAGVVLLVDPFGSGGASVVGLLGAFGGGVCWGLYLLLSARLGARLPGVDGLTAAMIVAAVLWLPVGVLEFGTFASVEVLALALGIAVISVALPLSLETLALKRLTLTAAGVLTSLEPALAAAAGYLMLGQRLSPAEIAGVALVVVASAGAVRAIAADRAAA